MHVIAAKAVAFGECLTDSFNDYIIQVIKNAKALAGALTEKGYNLVSGGTDNHLMLVDLQNKGVTGKEAQNALDHANITCNKNAVPNDPKPPLVTSGIRLGTPALTSRGFKEDDFRQIAEFIDRVITNHTSETVIAQVAKEVEEFAGKFELYADYDGKL